MKTEIQKDLTDLENRIAQMTNVLTDYMRMTVERLQPLFDAVEKATALIEAKNGTQDATKCAEGMTNEEAIQRLKEGAPFSGLHDKEWEEALNMAIEAMQKETPDTWIIGREDGRLTYTHDTEDCLTIVNVGFPYCPYCGKKMKL